VVLGASSGTGAAIARAVARDPGLHVFGAHRGRHPEEAEALQAEVGEAGRRFAAFVGDAGTIEGVEAGVEALAAAAGPRSVRFFVHSLANASVGLLASGGADQLVPRQFHKTFDSMAHSFVWWVQGMLARDLLAPGARLLALTSPLHEQMLRQCSLVLGSKAALEAYVRHLAFELGPRGYRVNMLKFPTVMTTAVGKVYSPEALARLQATHQRIIPAGRMCTVDEVGRFVSLLLDERAEWLNGATIDYSGGMTQSLLDLILVAGAEER
jgi:NAD(P)-dependent dehydrogenase (short-subunit alcohol dehydrogenase family)